MRYFRKLSLCFRSGFSLATDQIRAIPDIACFLGNTRIVEILRRAVGQERLPHAMIFAGPSGVGKRTLAILLAQIMNCLQRQGINSCGKCASCQKIRSGWHPDVRETHPDGAFIKIDQVRNLINEIAYQPFEGRYRIVIFDPADRMRAEAANSLLKTLEEPPSRTIIILVTTNPYLLLETIRSRSRILQFGGIPQPQIEDYLVKVAGRSPADARLTAIFSEGSLGAALAFDTSEYREIRIRALQFARLLLSGGSFAELSALSSVLAKQKDSFQSWIEAVWAILQDIYYAKVAPQRMGQQDILEDINLISRSTTRSAVLSAMDGIKHIRGALRRNVNRQIALEALFLEHRAAHARQTG
jgi:DNA polymerase III subunit delta'